jgi:hypothetical protein
VNIGICAGVAVAHVLAKPPGNSPGAFDVSCQQPHQQPLEGDAVQSGVVTVQLLVHDAHGPAPSGMPPEMYWYCRSNAAIGAAVESFARPTSRWLLPSAARSDEPRHPAPPSEPAAPDEEPLDDAPGLPLLPPLLPPALPLPLLPPPLLAPPPPSAAVAPPFELLQLGINAAASNPTPSAIHFGMRSA